MQHDFFRELLNASRRQLWVTGTVTALGGVCTIAVLMVLRIGLRRAESGFAGLITLFAVLAVLAVALRIASQGISNGLSKRATGRLSRDVAGALLRARLDVVEKFRREDLLTVFVNDVPSAGAGPKAIALLFGNGFILVSCLSVLGYFSIHVFAVAMFLVLVVGVVQIFAIPQFRAKAKAAHGDYQAQLGIFGELVSAVKELKLNRFKREAFIQEGLRPVLVKPKKDGDGGEGAGKYSWISASGGVGRLLFLGLLALVLIGFPRWGFVAQNEVGVYVILLLFTMQPLEALRQQSAMLIRSRVAAGRVGDLLGKLGDRPDDTGEVGTWPDDGWKQIQLNRGEESGGTGSVPGSIEMEFGRGEVHTILGSGGSGKNALAKFIAGLYPESGATIAVDGREVEKGDYEGYRQLFSIVLSEFHLFEAQYGMGWIEQEGAGRKYSELAGVPDLVRYEEGEARFGGGGSPSEARRLAFVSALMEDRPVVILDLGELEADEAFITALREGVIPAVKAEKRTLILLGRSGSSPVPVDSVWEIREDVVRRPADA